MRNTTTIQSGYHLIFRHLFSVCLACLSVLLICTLSHTAGINTDGTLGPATTLTPGGPKGNDYTIPSNLGQQKGSNLFHSFGNFNVDTGYTATFTGSAGTANVIGRVTGGNSSWIDGRLGCDITGANLWLLNPFGILFGPNASLNVNGSFHASTANYLQLSDGGVFYTDPSKTSKLTIAAPSAFGFLSSKPKEITISGSNLTVESGKTLSLIGGNINIVNGQLIAPSGKINLVSLASPGEVVLNEDGIAVTGSPELGDIRISTTDEVSQLLSTTHAASTVLQPQFGTDESINELAQSSLLHNKMAGQASSSLINVSGSKEDATSSGSVDIYCKKFSLDNSGISSDNYSDYKGGKIRLVAEKSASFDNLTYILSRSYGKGAGGDIDIQTENLGLTNTGQILAIAYGRGSGGDVMIKAKEVLIDGGFESSTGISLSKMSCRGNSGSTGNAGSLNIDTESLTLSNGGRIEATTYGSGSGGNVTIKAKNVSIDSGFDKFSGGIYCQSYSTGNAGSLNIDTESLTLSNRGRIDATTYGSGSGGNVTIKAKNVSIDGGCESSVNDAPGGIYSFAGKGSTGKAGSLNIDAESLTLSNGGQIAAATFGSGDGGIVTITTKDVLISGGSESSIQPYLSGIYCRTEKNSTGNAGSLNINAESLALSNGGRIEASTRGSGNAGVVTIKAKDVLIDGSFEASNGGYHDSLIDCQAVTGSTGNAGSLNIDTELLTLSNGGQISASTYGSGNGGDVTIKAKDVSIDGGFESSNGLYPSTINCIAARDSSGKAGNISLQANTLSMSNGGAISVTNYGEKAGGSIGINVANLTMNSGAVISSASTGTGDAGNINLTIADKLESRNSTITTESTQADGGDITITNTGFLTYLINSSITATVGGGPQTTGGNILINSPYVVLKDSHVIANAYEGKGGNIDITADTYLADWTSTISASSALGISGQVDINSPLVNLSGLLSPLPTTFADITELLADDCETRYKYRKVSSLAVRGRDALPAQPGDLWPSPVMMR